MSPTLSGTVNIGRVITLVVTFFLLATSLLAQDYQTYLDKGDKYASVGDRQNAIENFQAAERLNPGSAEVNLKLGKAYLSSNSKYKSLTYLEKVLAIQPGIDPDINYHLGEAYQYNHQFAKAKEQYELSKTKNNKLANIVDFRIQECILGDSIIRKPLSVKISNLGSEINSVYDDYAPLITTDGSTLIFTSNRKSSANSKTQGPSTNFEDIYIAHTEQNQWTVPEKISSSVNIEFHDAAVSMSPDGRTLFLYYEQGAGDIFVSTQEGSEWSKPKALNSNINTTFWETSACISADGKRLYFTSNRPGGYGKLDLYESQLTDKGDWGKAVNMGPFINTKGNEDAPYIHADGRTMYFGSDGHIGLGDTDIFKSELKEGKWQKPKNIGYPINSAEFENFFVISADNKTAYFSSSREDRIGKIDIYMAQFKEEKKPAPKKEEVIVATKSEVKKVEIPVTLPPAVAVAPVIATTAVVTTKPIEPVVIETPKPVVETKPVVKETKPIVIPVVEKKKEGKEGDYLDPILQFQKDLQNVTVLRGKVIDAFTTTPLGAQITLIDNEHNTVLAKITSNSTTGEFELTIPHGGNYGVATEVSGYLFNSINFNVPNFSAYKEVDTHILMVKAKVGSKITLKNVFFDFGKANLKPQSLSELENIHKLLTNNPNLLVQINGHTDNVGKAVYNKALSLKRAQAVVDFLIQQGIQKARLSAVGYGSERPIVSNDDEIDGREINRRTEVEIIEAKKK